MRRRYCAALLFFPLLFFFIFGGCAPAESLVSPVFWNEAVVKTEKITGRLSNHYLVVETPENLMGMECTVAGEIVSVSYAGITKSSDLVPGIRELEPARVLLTLESLSAAPMNFAGKEEEGIRYTAATPLGDFSLLAGEDGRLRQVKNETTDFWIQLTESVGS